MATEDDNDADDDEDDDERMRPRTARVADEDNAIAHDEVALWKATSTTNASN